MIGVVHARHLLGKQMRAGQQEIILTEARPTSSLLLHPHKVVQSAALHNVARLSAHALIVLPLPDLAVQPYVRSMSSMALGTLSGTAWYAV